MRVDVGKPASQGNGYSGAIVRSRWYRPVVLVSGRGRNGARERLRDAKRTGPGTGGVNRRVSSEAAIDLEEMVTIIQLVGVAADIAPMPFISSLRGAQNEASIFIWIISVLGG